MEDNVVYFTVGESYPHFTPSTREQVMRAYGMTEGDLEQDDSENFIKIDTSDPDIADIVQEYVDAFNRFRAAKKALFMVFMPYHR